MNYSKRLTEFADFIGKHASVFDIGSDHGKLEVILASMDPETVIIASDISQKALDKTKIRIKEAGLENRVTCRTGDGFSVLNENDFVECVTIAGIGGYVISDILKAGSEWISKLKDFYFLPSTDVETLRRSLPHLGLKILEERTVEDQHRIYSMIHAVAGIEIHTDSISLRYGFWTVKNKDAGTRKIIEKHLKHMHKALTMINESGNTEQKLEIENELLLPLYSLNVQAEVPVSFRKQVSCRIFK